MFKPGDKVVCINNVDREDEIEHGRIYTVKGYMITPYGDKERLVLNELPHKGFKLDRFEPLRSKVWNKPGCAV